LLPGISVGHEAETLGMHPRGDKPESVSDK
jgi:hypothetical protein